MRTTTRLGLKVAVPDTNPKVYDGRWFESTAATPARSAFHNANRRRRPPRNYDFALGPDDVNDFASFIKFVNWLGSDRADEVAKERVAPSHPMGPGINGWENTTIEAFLEAAAACAADRRDKTGHEPEPTWREFAQFVLGGKIYE